ncbi:MAG: ScyD/ScyE family protein [Anaerolineae bacterium]
MSRKIKLILLMIIFSTVIMPQAQYMYPQHVIATNLQNPRGVAILPDGRLIVAEAGTGFVGESDIENTGKLSLFDDSNNDGDYDDAGERVPIITHLPGYNILYQFQPARDEVVGVGDVITLDDGRIFFTLDDHFEVLSIVEINADFQRVGNLYRSDSTINALVYDDTTATIYATLSSTNALAVITMDGRARLLTIFDALPHGQQAVPAGIAIDPTTGDLLVALFSGQLWDYYGEVLSFMAGDARVVRVNPQTGAVTDEVTGLTTAVDVTLDEVGNLYVVEMTTEWAMPTMDTHFDLYAADAPPDAGGYARFSGRITMYPIDGSAPIVIAEDLDAPTNITYHDGDLYVSVGQGTPDRRIWVDGELRHITGQLIKIAVTE